jgi:N-methylhydantoinase B
MALSITSDPIVSSGRSGIDPATVEVIRCALRANLDEIELTLCRTAHSSTIYEIRDMCAGWVDPTGQIIAQGRYGLPIFMSDLGSSILRGIELYADEGFEPGDVFITNHAASCGQHLSNVVVYSPMFHEGELLGFTACRAHWNDVGGKTVGSYATDTTEIFQEGIQFDNLRVMRGGREDAATLRFIQANVRFPAKTIGDLRAQVTACRLGERRFLALVEKYGLETLQTAIQTIWDQSEIRARQVIRDLPDGTHRAVAWMDNDGVDLSRRLEVHVAVTIDGDDLIVDFTGTSGQATGPLNCGEPGAIAAARVAFKCITSPSTTGDEGSFRSLRVVVPPDTFISARHPAPLNQWSTHLATVIDTVLHALSPVLPEQIPAGHQGDMPACFFVQPPSSDRPGFVHSDPFPGGWGARHDGDGPVTLKSYCHGDTYKIPIEVEELSFPFRVVDYSMRTDSGGPGRFRGAPGIDRSFEILDDVYVTVSLERSTCQAWGVFGGGDGGSPVATARFPDGGTERFNKATMKLLPRGTSLTISTAGGGGYGPAYDRDPERVRIDVIRGFVSCEAARNIYGVIVGPEPDFDIDVIATERCRQELQKGQSRHD